MEQPEAATRKLTIEEAVSFAIALQKSGQLDLYYGHVRILGNLSEFRNYQQFSVNITSPSYPRRAVPIRPLRASTATSPQEARATVRSTPSSTSVSAGGTSFW